MMKEKNQRRTCKRLSLYKRRLRKKENPHFSYLYMQSKGPVPPNKPLLSGFIWDTLWSKAKCVHYQYTIQGVEFRDTFQNVRLEGI